MSYIPENAYILLSFINTKLRDEYSSLSELCKGEDADEECILSTLEGIGYAYDREENKFILR